MSVPRRGHEPTRPAAEVRRRLARPGRSPRGGTRGGRGIRGLALLALLVFAAGAVSTAAGEQDHPAGISCPDRGDDGRPCGPACACSCCPGHAAGLAVSFDRCPLGPPSQDAFDVLPGVGLHAKDVLRVIFHPPRA